ncbi:MAG: FAD-dependent oxidoreductase [Sedimentisphaeraceae bacterium JB056]
MSDNHVIYDVVVIGGGLAGCSAAIATRRLGAKVLMVERLPFAGGAWTGGMVTHVAGLIDHDRIYENNEYVLDCSKWIVQGLACDYHDILKQYGAAKGIHWDHEAGKFIFDLMLEKEGVDVLYGTQFFSANIDGETVKSVELIYRTTKITVEAKVFIDASGDGDLGAACGCEFYYGREADGKMSPATLSYMIGDIDRSCLFSEEDYGVPIGGLSDLEIAEKDDAKEDLNTILKKAHKNGSIPRDMRPAAICMKYAEGRERNELWCSFVRQWGDITNPWQYSDMEKKGRKTGWQIFRFLKDNTKSCRESYLSGVGTQIWPRECRHFKAHYIVNADDYRDESRFEDVVARGGFYLDLHSVTPGNCGFDLDERRAQRDRYFEIPYRSLVPLGKSNLLFAGRTIGADHKGHSATRVMGTGIATGQAAGTAAGIFINSKLENVLDVDITELQNSLRANRAVI